MKPAPIQSFKGVVQSGQGKGKKMGAATANLDVKLVQGLKKGLYQCQIVWRGQLFNGLLYYGFNSLSGQDCLEVHLAGLDEDIVGEEIQIIMGSYLRPPQVFGNVEKLQSQIKIDLEFLKK